MSRSLLRRPSSGLGAALVLFFLAPLPGLSAASTGSGEENPEAVLGPIREAWRADRPQEAILLVDRALAERRTGPEAARIRAELHFWRGASLRKLARHEEALVAFDLAHRQGFRLPELYLERALARKASGQEEDAGRDFQEAERLIPDEDLERKARIADRWRRDGRKEPTLKLTLSPEAGYDSNLLGLEEDSLLGQDEFKEESPFFGATFSARWFPIESERQAVYLEYRNHLRTFIEESELGYSDNLFSLVARQPLHPAADFEVRASLSDAFLEGDGHFRTGRTIGPAFLLHPSSRWFLRLWTDWTDLDYYESDIVGALDRDGTLRRGGLAIGVDLGGGWSLGPAMTLSQYETQGTEYDNESWTAGFQLVSGRYLGSILTSGVTYSRGEYENPSLSEPAEGDRRDRIVTYTVSVALKGLEEAIGFGPTLSFSFVDHGSNVKTFDYDRWEPRIEATLLSLSF